MKPTGGQLKEFALVLNDDYDSLELAAEAILKAAWELYEQRGAYTVVGQLRGGQKELVALRQYETEGTAWDAARAFAVDATTGEEYVVTVCPIFNGSPAELFKDRRTKANDKLRLRAENEHEGTRWQITWWSEQMDQWVARIAPNELWPPGEDADNNTKPTFDRARRAWNDELKRRKAEG